MTNYVIEPAQQVSLPVRGSDAVFPVRRIYCIGRNYADHAIEMGHDPDKEPPFFFQKNAENVDTSGEEDALDHVFGYGLGLDMTRRDLQGEAKKMGRPWEIGKAFERSAPMSELVSASDTGHLDQGRIALQVNGAERQIGDLNQMIWKVPEMIAYLSRFYDIAAGDLIMSGTPAGVGPIERGDVMVGEVEGIGSFTVTVV